MDDYITLTRPVYVFSSAMVRDSVLTAPAEGDYAYLTDVHAFDVWHGSWEPVG